MVGTATEKSGLLILGLVLRTKSSLETNDLRVLEMSEKCSRLTNRRQPEAIL